MEGRAFVYSLTPRQADLFKIEKDRKKDGSNRKKISRRADLFWMSRVYTFILKHEAYAHKSVEEHEDSGI